jgi:drug/metabolite transporter (DMT)-like permease
MMDVEEDVRGVIYTFIGVVLWSILGIFVRQVPELSSGLIILYRFIFASLVLLLYAVVTKRLPMLRVSRSELVRLIMPGILIAFTIYTYTVGIKNTTIANTVFLQQLAPIYVLIISYFFLKENITRRTTIAVLIGITGGFLILWYDYGGAVEFGGTHFYGDLVATASGFGWATYTIAMRLLGKTHEGITSTFWLFLFAAIITLPFAGTSGMITGYSLAMLFIMGSFCTALSFILYNIALRHLEAAKASVIVLMEGVLSGIWAYLILAEKVNPGTIIGGALIIVATGIIIQESRAKSREAPYEEGVIE